MCPGRTPSRFMYRKPRLGQFKDVGKGSDNDGGVSSSVLEEVYILVGLYNALNVIKINNKMAQPS